MHQDRNIAIAAYLGGSRDRPSARTGRRIVERMIAEGFPVRTILVHPDGPSEIATELGIESIVLPPFLGLPRAGILRALSTPAGVEGLGLVRRKLTELGVDAGLVFYGAWLPPALFEIPPLGFLNFHPASLPELRGYECDSFAILQGRSSIHGTVHRVVEEFDAGDILSKTSEIPLDRWTTPRELLDQVDARAPEAFAEAFHALRSLRSRPRSSLAGNGFIADSSRLLAHSAIDPARDDSETVWSKFRVFHGQSTGVRLRAPDPSGRNRFVEDLRFPQSAFSSDRGDWSPLRLSSPQAHPLEAILGDTAPDHPSFREGPPPSILERRDLLLRRPAA